MFRYLRKSKLIKNLAVYSSSSTLAQFIMMVYTIILARSLGPEALGIFAGAYSIAGLSVSIINWGMDTWLLREAGVVGNPRELAGHVLAIKSGLGTVWVLALVAVVPFVRPDLFSVPLIMVVVVDVWSDVCFNTEISALNTQGRMREITWLLMISRVGRIAGAITLAVIGVASPFPYAITRSMATVASFVAATLMLRPSFNQITLKILASVVRQAIPYGFSDFFAIIYANADVTMLTLMAGKRAVGEYSPATGIVHALFIVPNAIFTVLVPAISSYAKNDIRRLYHLTWKMILGYAAIGLALWSVIGPGSDLLIRIVLGNAYATTGGLLEILSPILFMKSVEFGCAAILVAIGWQTKRLGPQIISAASNLLFNLWAIPRFGVFGVAWVYVISEAIIFLGYGWLTFRWMRKIRIKEAELNVQQT
jgi:O-antigen/teichoic acid export membrane protein